MVAFGVQLLRKKPSFRRRVFDWGYEVQMMIVHVASLGTYCDCLGAPSGAWP